jgi:membrane protein DedA with SNARE-associated domain
MRKCKPMHELFITVQPYIDHYGYFAVFGAILLEDFGMPVPGETLLIAGALLASRGKMDIKWRC